MADFTNTTNLTARFAGPAAPTDPIANPDVDQAMGYAPNENDDAATSFGKAFQSAMFRNSDEGRTLATQLAKEKLANQLAMQLEERKLQLAKQYPTYEHFATNPITGATTGFTKFGASAVLNELSADQQGMMKSKFEAEQAKASADAKEATSRGNYYDAISSPKALEADQKVKTMQAQAALATARAGAVGHPVVKPLSPADEERVQKIAMQNVYPGYVPGKHYSNRQFDADQKAGIAEQKIKDEADRVRQTFQPQGNSGLGTPSAPPDFGNLLAPLNVGD
jgi:hypothetical protein